MKSRVENKIFYTNQTLNICGRLISFDNPKIMGILNITPDSFYDGGRYDSEGVILSQVERMMKEGATFIDVGGYSSRPGADEIPVEEETRRITNAIQVIKKKIPEAVISIDTFRSEVAYAAVNEGAAMINDISGGELDTAMFEMVSKLQIPYVMMHMRGDPRTMTKLTEYENVVKDVADYFHSKIGNLNTLGVKDIIIDPGFGFAKTIEQNFKLLSALEYFKIFGRPILVGLSRKSMIWKTLSTTPDLALNGTTCLNTISLIKGANILRVHDVREAAEICKLISMIEIKSNENLF
ncbi:dihydropteroate synthase [Chryseolinea sp. H1M3-3]|uniref:dihydropteroate synthase n=1 Tax=Chryseolinea sp. H1M3-3 TaxID=3034144 RepID=UPI0023EC63DB|nr:dihydropteroate synthase [Chryseolinea sp. H1M3-3]